MAEAATEAETGKTAAQISSLSKMSKKSVALYHRFALSIGISDSALGVLYALSEADGPLSQYDLCSEWSIPKQTVNTTVSALQKKGLASLSPAQGARNKKNLALTAAGRKFVAETIGELRTIELSALKVLSPEEREQFVLLNQKYNVSLSQQLESALAPASKN